MDGSREGCLDPMAQMGDDGGLDRVGVGEEWHPSALLKLGQEDGWGGLA